MFITDTVGEYDVALMCEDPWQECYLRVELPRFNVVRVDKIFKNARVLSATLASELGTGPAKDLLEKHSVPKNNPLWDLNHSGFWDQNASL